MTDNPQKRFSIPAPDDPRAATLLFDFLKIYLRQENRSYLFDDPKDEGDVQGIGLFPRINKQLRQLSRKEWPRAEAERIFNLVDDEVGAERLKRHRSRAGRKATPRSKRVHKIEATLGCLEKWAYHVEAKGTNNLEHRQMLATAFADDSERCNPVNWEPDSARRRGRPGKASEYTMRDFALSGTDEFEPHGMALCKLACRYTEHGDVPDTFSDSSDLIAVTRDLGIGTDDALAVWKAFRLWQIAQRAEAERARVR